MGNLFKFKPAKEDTGLNMQGYFIWCSSVIKGDDGVCHMFASRFDKNLPMHPGWLLNSEIIRATSKEPLGPYEFCEVVLPRRGSEFWDGQMTHNPHIKKVKDKYLLFYTGTTYPFDTVKQNEKIEYSDHRVIVARSNKRIGIAIADRLNGKWERLDQPILTTRPQHFDSYLISNPSPIFNDDTSSILVYKSRKYIDYKASDMYFGIATSSGFNQPYTRVEENRLFTGLSELEDPFIWKDIDGYKMIAKDMTGQICGEERAGVYAMSKNGIDWEIAKDTKAYSRRILFENGKIKEFGNFERPFILFENNKPKYLFGAVSDGKSGILDCQNTWNMALEIDG